MKSMIMAFIGSILVITSANAKTTPVIKPTLNPLHSIPVTDAAGLLSNGTLDIISFVVNNGSTWAVCKVRGICGGIDIDEDCLCPVTVDPCEEVPPRLNYNEAKPFHCDCIEIRLGSCTVPRLLGLSLNLNPQNVQCTINDFSSTLLCTIHDTPRFQTGLLVSLLNQLL